MDTRVQRWHTCLYDMQGQTFVAFLETQQRSCVGGGSVRGPSTPLPGTTIPWEQRPRSHTLTHIANLMLTAVACLWLLSDSLENDHLIVGPVRSTSVVLRW